MAAFKVKVKVMIQNVDVCLGNSFRTIEHFVIKLGMVMQHHEPECCAQKKEKEKGLLSSRSRSQRGHI